jgi:hypothetical protein
LNKNNKGQSTIEFILTFTSTVGFIFLFLKMSLNYTNGYMVQHAVFMASRGYLVHDRQLNDASFGDFDANLHAKDIFKKYLPKGLITSFNSELKINSPSNTSIPKVFVGVWVEFEQMFSVGFIGGKDLVKFRAESFLGREPTRYEGYTQVCEAIKVIPGSGCAGTNHVTLDDNGG